MCKKTKEINMKLSYIKRCNKSIYHMHLRPENFKNKFMPTKPDVKTWFKSISNLSFSTWKVKGRFFIFIVDCYCESTNSFSTIVCCAEEGWWWDFEIRVVITWLRIEVKKYILRKLFSSEMLFILILIFTKYKIYICFII